MLEFNRRSFVLSGLLALGSISSLNGCSASRLKEEGGVVSGKEGGDKSISEEAFRIVTPYYTVNLPEAWRGKCRYTFDPDSHYLSDDPSMSQFGPHLSVFYDGDFCTFMIGMSKPAPGDSDVAYYEGSLQSVYLGKAGKEDEWDVFVSSAFKFKDGVPEGTVADVEECASWVQISYSPEEVTDPRILLSYLSTEEGNDWVHSKGAARVAQVIRDAFDGAPWFGIDPEADLSKPFERDNVPGLNFAVAALDESNIRFEMPHSSVSFSLAARHLAEDDPSRSENNAKYEIKEWKPLARDVQYYESNISYATQDNGIAIEIIESVDQGLNWEKSTIELYQASPYNAEPFLAMRFGDTQDMVYRKERPHFAESLENQGEYIGEAQSLLVKYMAQVDGEEREYLQGRFGSSPEIVCALLATFENAKFEESKGFLIKIAPGGENQGVPVDPRSAWVLAALYDYGNGTVWFDCWW